MSAMRLLAAAGCFLFVMPAIANAQQWLMPRAADTASTDSAAAATTSRRLAGSVVRELPVDSIAGALLLEPGVTATDAGLSLRGTAPGSHSVYVNGIDMTPSHRRVLHLPAPGSIGGASVVTGPLPAWAGGSGSAALRLETPGSEARGSRLSWETDRFTSGLGLNRFEGSIGREDRTSRVFLGGLLFGQKSVEPGADAELVPVFSPAGVDTTVAVAGLGEVTVPAWRLARGDCDRFDQSSVPGIAANYDAPCSGQRTPGSAVSGYRMAAAGDYSVGRTTRLSALLLRGRDTDRLFDYSSISNPANAFGRQSESSVYGLALSGPTGPRRTGSWRISISRQREMLVVAPLTAESEAETRDPAGGLMLGGFDFRWDLETFPVDSELIANYRTNRPGSRRSPYELENTDQYRTLDRFNDGPYAGSGFDESGGPVGLLSLFEEKRTVAAGSGTWRVSANSDFTLGGEYVKYSVASYDHFLTSQAYSNIYDERPTRGAIFAEDHFAYGDFIVAAGLRYDFFNAGGDRPWVLDTVSALPGGGSNPAFGAYHPFPRISSYTDADGTFLLRGAPVPLVVMREDERHTAWSPTLRAQVAISDATRLRAGLSRTARMPDLAQSFRGINTDFAITAFDHVYGSDLGFERAWTAEAGVTHALSDALTGDVALYRRATTAVPLVVVAPLRDPTRQNAEVGVRQLQGAGRETARGVETRLGWRSAALRGTIAWSWQRVRSEVPFFDQSEPVELPTAWERPHMVSATLGYTAPDGGGRGLLRDGSLLLTFRAASGTPYVPCPGFGFSDEPCGDPGATLERERLPSFRQLDLRFVKRIGGRRSASLYLDVRNLLGRRNVRRVYAATGTTTSDAALQRAREVASSEWLVEGEANGVVAGAGLDLTFAGQGAGGCGGWVAVNGDPAAPNCVALVRAEQRWGNGDGVFTAEEQMIVADAEYAAFTTRGLFSEPRRIRLGIEIGF